MPTTPLVPLPDGLEIIAVSETSEELLVHGAARGLDRMAGHAASRLGWNVLDLKTPWGLYLDAAGPIRNQAG